MDLNNEKVVATLRELGIPDSFLTKRPHIFYDDCADLMSIGLDMCGREQRLERRTALQWQLMLTEAAAEGVMLAAVSGFRSFDYQRQLIARKLAAGETVEQVLSASAIPGFSEHHTGRAIDIGVPGLPALTEEFEQTPSFAWLTKRAQDFGFWMTYPRGNPFGIIYEPWHWCHRE